MEDIQEQLPDSTGWWSWVGGGQGSSRAMFNVGCKWGLGWPLFFAVAVKFRGEGETLLKTSARALHICTDTQSAVQMPSLPSANVGDAGLSRNGGRCGHWLCVGGRSFCRRAGPGPPLTLDEVVPVPTKAATRFDGCTTTPL